MILLTTPTGAIGRQLLTTLLAADDEPIRVIARDPSRLPAEIRERVEVIPGSHGDAAVLAQALPGAEAVFWLPPPALQAPSLAAAYLDFTRPLCQGLRDHGVKRVVSVSALGRGSPWVDRAGFVTASLAMDALIAATGVAFRALTMPSFMDNVLRQVDAIRSRGVFVSPLAGDRRVPTCATGDIAAAAAKLLLDPSWGGADSVPVLGPEDLSLNDMAQIMTEVLGKPVRFQPVSFEAFHAGVSGAMAQGLVDMMRAKNEGLDNAEPRTAANTTPTSFRVWCEAVLKPAVVA